MGTSRPSTGWLPSAAPLDPHRPSPRYFARGRGVTWLNYLTDQFAGLHAIVVPGTLRDSLMILDGLLELAPPSEGGPTVIITDQASYSDQIFGLFWLLGYQFSPRPAGLPDHRFWRIDHHADYGPLDGLARQRINTHLIVEQREDILRVAGSLSTGTVRASELLRVLQGGGRPSRLGRAIAELGRVAKTVHLLAWIDSEQLRRETGVGLNRHESRHSVARVIFHGNEGQLRQPYRDGQEDQLGALGFALNALVLWNAQYLDDAIVQLRTTGHQITDEDLRRLSPLQHEHVKMLGHFPFTLSHELAAGARRQLRELGLALACVPVPLLPGGPCSGLAWVRRRVVSRPRGYATSRRSRRHGRCTTTVLAPNSVPFFPKPRAPARGSPAPRVGNRRIRERADRRRPPPRRDQDRHRSRDLQRPHITRRPHGPILDPP
jgi:TnpA family transposase